MRLTQVEDLADAGLFPFVLCARHELVPANAEEVDGRVEFRCCECGVPGTAKWVDRRAAKSLGWVLGPVETVRLN